MNRFPNGKLARFVLVVAMVAAVGRFAAAEDKKMDLKVGDPAPSFQGVDAEGNPWKSEDYLGKYFIVVYFYPGDFTPGCTRQAQVFRDTMNKLADQGIVVVGISGDSVMTHQLFKKAQKLNFTLLADEEAKLAKMFGVPVGKGGTVRTKDADGKPLTLKRNVTAARWTFVIDLKGKIVSKNTKVIPAQDSKSVADLVEKLKK